MIDLPDIVLTRDEIVAEIEREARRHYGISAAAMFAALRKGELDDDDVAFVMWIHAGLLPDNDPIFAAA